MLYLFLDIDGVMNSWQSIHYFSRRRELGLAPINRKDDYHSLCPIAISNLNCLMDEFPDMQIVISSTWRKYNTIGELKKIFFENGFLHPEKIIDKTGELDGCRGDEILEWVMGQSQVKDYVILDDDSDMGPVMSHLIQTDQRVGFDFITFCKVCCYLEDKGIKPANKIGVCAL